MMSLRTAETGVRPRVLIAYGDLLEYRVPIFSALGKACDLTVCHSGRQMTDGTAGFTEVVLPRQRLWRFHFQSGLRKLIQSGGFDTVIYFMDIAWPATVANFLFPPRPVRRVIWGLWRTGRMLPDTVRLWLARRADFNVFYSCGAAEDFIAHGLSRDRVSVAHNTVCIAVPARNNSARRDTILVVGSFNPRKENHVTLAAFTAVARAVAEPVRLVFVGAGSQLAEVKALAAQSGMADRIEFHPACHDEEVLRDFYDRAICSVSHGQAGLSVLQSFAYGVPFVTRRGAISGGEIENIETGVNGYLTSGTQQELETVLGRLITRPDEAEDLGNAALHHYRTCASTAHMITGFLEAIDPVHYRNSQKERVETEKKHCEACESGAVSLHHLRQDLAYWICRDCGHCMMDTANQDAEDFEKAQEVYFGEDSILVQTEPTAIDCEILTERERVTSNFLPPRGRVLEVGPGAGFLAELLQRRGHQLRLIEHSPVLARRLKLNLGVPVDTAEFESMEIAPNSFDAFCSFHVIEHVPDPLRHLTTGFTAVRPGGIGLVATPNARSWQQSWFRRLSPNFDAAHLRVFSPASLRRFCEQAGWEVVCVETPEFASGWLRVLSKALRRMRGEDENLTAGKYSGMASARVEGIYTALAALTWPIRLLQRLAGRGNEVLFVLKKAPILDPAEMQGAAAHNNCGI